MPNQSSGHQPATAPRIAVVEDDAAMRTALGRLLFAYGYRTELYPDSESLLQRQNLNEIGCLILDVKLPGMSGLALQVHLRHAGFQVPVVFLSAVSEWHVQKHAETNGCIAFLEKPAEGQLLLAAVRSVL
jgi:FixJ family two-component response regulator